MLSRISVRVTAFCLGAVCVFVSFLFNRHQPEPYMDEVFHIPQAQAYCHGNFSQWDPMITTLPGLYLSSLLWVLPLSKVLSVPIDLLCVPALLRAQNVFLTVCLFVCGHWLLTKIQHSHGSIGLLLSAINLSTFPILFFFSFLYYTDVGSTLLVLWGYTLTLSEHHLISAIVLLCAVCFRQTSIVWLVFVAGTAGVKIIEPNFYTRARGKYWTLSYPLAIVRSVLSNIHPLVSTLWPYLIVVLTFVAFIIVNGSIVVGDKKSHTACFHVPQLFYFSLFSCFLSSPHLVLNYRLMGGLRRALTRRLKWGMAFMFVTIAGAAAVYYFTYAHPYLLADNRHYLFYLWKNVFRAFPPVKYCLLPVYSLCALTVVYTLSRTESALWVLLFCVCTFTALVPQGLLEFRYFITPYLIYRIHIPRIHGNGRLILALFTELTMYSALNVFTIYVFLYRPFLWPDSQQLQRFMW